MIERHPALKGKPERFFIYTDIISGEQFVAEQKGKFGVYLYNEVKVETTEILKADPASDKEDISDYRSWLHLEGITGYSKPEQFEDISIIDSEGTEIKIYLDGKNRIKERYINGKNRYYWSKTKMVYDNNSSYLEYKNSEGVHTKTYRNNGKTVCNWISGKPNITNYGKRN